MVVAQEQEEHGRARQQHTRQRLHRVCQQPERRTGGENKRSRQRDETAIDCVEHLGLFRLSVQRVVQGEHVADRVGGRQSHSHRTDDARIDQGNSEEHAGGMSHMLAEAGGDRTGVLETAERGTARESRCRKRHHRDRANEDEKDADPQVRALITNEAGRDALVDDVALLEEKLPRRDGRADDRNDQQHHLAELAVRGKLRDHQIMRDLTDRRMNPEEHRDQQQTPEHQEQRKALKTAEIARASSGNDNCGRGYDAQLPRQSQIVQRQADADELRDDCQGVQQEQINDAEYAPELAEALQDQPGMADAGHHAQTQNHLLIHVEYRNQQQERPQQGGPIVLPGLGIGAERAGIVVADHDDETWPQDREQGSQAWPPATAGRNIAMTNGAERAADIADMRFIEDGAGARRPAEVSRGHSQFSVRVRCRRIVGTAE